MSLHVAAVDLYEPSQAAIWLDLLDHYARDPMGGGEGLSDYAKLHLVNTIRQVPGFHGALAWQDGQAVGLIDCFAGFSTFAAKPLLNVHDIVVHASWRGRGIGQALLAWADDMQEIKTICHSGSKATMTVRVDAQGRAVQDGPQVEIGGNERYVSVSRAEFKKIMRGEGSIEPLQETLPLH